MNDQERLLTIFLRLQLGASLGKKATGSGI